MTRFPDMLNLARRATAFLDAADRADVVAFIRGRQQADGGFSGRGRGSDLYYTVFAGATLLALGHPPAVRPLSRYLDRFGDGSGCDFVHLTALIRCRAALPLPVARRRARDLLPRLERHRAPDGGYRHEQVNPPAGTAYGGFLAALAYREAEAPMPDAARALDAVRALRTPDGGYANAPGLATATTTATAAVVLLRHWQNEPSDAAAVDALEACRCPRGGYRASTAAPAPDLLSTATALYARHTIGLPPRPAIDCSHLDYLESLWHEDGGFRGHADDPVADCEYTFYALLALGSLNMEHHPSL